MEANPGKVKTYIVTFERTKDRRPKTFVVIASNQRKAIEIAWEHGTSDSRDFDATYDKASGQAGEMKRGAMRVL